MKKREITRKLLTFTADSICIIAGYLLCMAMFYPDATFADDLARIKSFVLVFLITMAMVSRDHVKL